MRPTKRAMRTFNGLRRVIAALRAPEGCPWDRVQTHQSLRPFLLEEASEALEALDAADPELKREERSGQSVLAGIPGTLPALAYAQAIQRRASRAGFTWETAEQAWEALEEELGELREAGTAEERREEVGDALFALAGLARWLEVDAEEALRSTCRGFETLFRRLEAALEEQGRRLPEMTLAEKLALWQEVKRTPDGG